MDKKECINRALTMEVIVGAFVVMVFLGMAYFTIILSRETWFGTKYSIDVVFESVMGLRDGDSVVVRGMPIGSVKTLTLEPDGVHVHCLLDEPLTLHEDYRVTISATSILGGRQLNIFEGTKSKDCVPMSVVLKGEKPYDLMEDAAQFMSAVREKVVDGGMLDNFNQASRDLREIADRLNRGEGTLGKLLSKDDTLYQDLVATVASTRKIMGRLADGKGTLGKLLSEDDTLYTNLVVAAASIRSIAERLNNGEGTLGKLLSKDDTLYTNLTATAASLRKITGKIANGEGTLGKLVNDDEMYTEIKSAVHDVRATVNDVRETTPVVTFTSIFFGVF